MFRSLEEACSDPEFVLQHDDIIRLCGKTNTGRSALCALGDLYLLASCSGSSSDSAARWKLFSRACESMIDVFQRLPSRAITDEAIFLLIDLIHIGYDAGRARTFRDASIAQSLAARRGKADKTQKRWRVVRRAILHVCQQQKLQLAATEAFADSIREDVKREVERCGLTRIFHPQF